MTKPSHILLGMRARVTRTIPPSAKLMALIFCTGCSFQNFDELTNGAGTTIPSIGGAVASGGTSVATVGGTTPTIGGTSAVALGGSSQGGTDTLPSQGGSSASQGGASQTGGSATGGASALPCPLYTGTAGTVLTPPSNTFESSMAGWSTVSEHASALTLVQGSAEACEGSGYVQCAGNGRTANWDGPALNVLPYLTQGRTYNATVAARFDPQNAPAAVAGILFSMALYCSDTAVSTQYLRIGEGATLTNWVRITGSLTTSLSGCPSLTRLIVYVESDSTGATSTIQIDDFQLVDITPVSTGTGGAPGTNTTNSGGSGPLGGAASVGGANPLGGASTAGGAPTAGGALGTGGADAGGDVDSGAEDG